MTRAASAYDAHTGSYPAGIDALVAGKYLKSAPAGTYTFDATAKTVTRDPACPPGPAAAATTTTATGRFTGLNGNCVDLALGTQLVILDCGTGAEQRWSLS